MGGGREREMRQLQKGKEKARRKGDLKEEAALCNQLGGLLARHGRFQEALEEHRQELHLLESADDVIGCAVAHRKIGECLAELESYEAALKHQRRHLELACSLSSHIEEQRAWATIGRTYMFMAESEHVSEALQEAEKAFMRSLAVLEEKLEGEVPQREASEMTARLYLNLGLVYDSLKNPAKHTYYIKKSIYIAEQAQLHEDLYRAYFNLGNIHLREGEHSKAMRCLERARECACKMGEKCMEGECCAGIAQVLLSLGDFTAAKRALKKAYRLGSQQPQQQESICRSLRYASKVSSLQQALEEAEASSHQQAALGLCEQLGDLFSKAGDYPRAAEAYEKQLSYAQALKRPEQELAVIHVSLAATFGDLKDHARAMEHYRAELALRQGNPLERGKTWLNIALAKEESRESYEELKLCFESALQCAEQGSDPRLQKSEGSATLHKGNGNRKDSEEPTANSIKANIAEDAGQMPVPASGRQSKKLKACQILQHLHACQQRCERPEAADTLVRLKDLCRAQGWRSDGEASEDEDLQDSEPVEASDLELSSSDEEADLGGHRTTGPGQRKINKWNQRNDKGETLLHRACIDGNLRQVRFFVEKGHPLNPRDYCGWTPLHEACNHGHLEIVRFLLDHGAAVDDPGGPGCEGITPLHDALNCGHFDVAELLVERGASVLLRNAKGLTPLGTLQAWVQLYGRDLDRETRQHASAMEQLLRKAMASRGSRAPLLQSQPASQLFDAELSESPTSCPPDPALVPHSPRGSPQEPEEGCVSPRKPIRRRWPLGWKLAREEASPMGGVGEEAGPGPAASAEYRAAMRGVGRAHSRHPPSPGGPKRPPGPALIPSEDYVGDDWLEDDLGPRPHSRKRGRQSPAEAAGAGAGSAESTASESDEGASRQPPEVTRKRRRQVRQSRLSHIVARAPLGRIRGTGAVGSPEAPANASRLQGASGGSRANGVPGHEECPPSGPTQLPAPPPPVRVRVRVRDSVFLIPVPHSESEGRPVSWLAEQASQRYYQSCGLLPRLTLKKEGALLAPQDRVVDVLQSNEEVLAEVQSWDLPPLVERYRKACRNLAVAEHRLLLKVLERQEAGPSFSVSGVTLRRLHLVPLFRALKLQASVQRLCLAGTGLGDDAAEELLASVGTMPGLTHLDLSANRLGPEGLHKLADGLSASAQRLDELDLSLNPLGDRSAQPLAALLRACPVLAVLRLQGCGFTSALLQLGRPLLASALGGAVQLRSLSVSHNALGAPGLDLLLKSLPRAGVTHLEIGSVGAGPEDRQPLQEALGRYLAQEGCALSRLTFSGNHLDDAAVAELARCLPCCPALVALDLSANRAVGTAGLQALLLALEERGHGLQFLSLAGCCVAGPLDGATWARLSSHVRQLQLCSRSVSRGDQRAVAELWQGPAGTTLHSVTRHHKLFCQCR